MFGDSTLDSLVARGLETNLTVAEAYHRSLASKAAIGSARAAFYPEIGLIAGYTHARTSGRTTSMSMNPVTESYFNAGLNASWELDIFGRIAKGVKAKKSAYMASKAEWAGAMVSITAQIASQYIQLRAFQARMAVAKAHLEVNTRSWLLPKRDMRLLSRRNLTLLRHGKRIMPQRLLYLSCRIQLTGASML